VTFHAVRTPVAWLLYSIGHAVSRVNNAIPERVQSERMAEIMYACYSRPMGWSEKVQGEYQGPWSRPEPWPED
jgi:hypothetical protein